MTLALNATVQTYTRDTSRRADLLDAMRATLADAGGSDNASPTTLTSFYGVDVIRAPYDRLLRAYRSALISMVR